MCTVLEHLETPCAQFGHQFSERRIVVADVRRDDSTSVVYDPCFAPPGQQSFGG